MCIHVFNGVKLKERKKKKQNVFDISILGVQSFLRHVFPLLHSLWIWSIYMLTNTLNRVVIFLLEVLLYLIKIPIYHQIIHRYSIDPQKYKRAQAQMTKLRYSKTQKQTPLFSNNSTFCDIFWWYKIWS